MAKKKSLEHGEDGQDNEHDDSLVVVDSSEPAENDNLAKVSASVDMLAYKVESLESYNELVDCVAALAAGAFDVVESILPKLKFGVQMDIEAICAGLKQAGDKRPAGVIAAEQVNDVGVPRVLDVDVDVDEFPDWLGKVADALADADYALSLCTFAVLDNGDYVLGPEHGKKLPFELVLAVQEAGAAIELVGDYYVVSAK